MRHFTKYPSNYIKADTNNSKGYDYFVTFTYSVGVFADSENDALDAACKSLEHDIGVDGVANVVEYTIKPNT